MVHDADLSRASLAARDAEALLALVQAGLAATTVVAVAALSARAALP